MIAVDTATDMPKVADYEDDLLHDCHLECQRDYDMVQLVCGLWDSQDNPDIEVSGNCPLCQNTNICPRCGAELVAY